MVELTTFNVVDNEHTIKLFYIHLSDIVLLPIIKNVFSIPFIDYFTCLKAETTLLSSRHNK